MILIIVVMFCSAFAYDPLQPYEHNRLSEVSDPSRHQSNFLSYDQEDSIHNDYLGPMEFKTFGDIKWPRRPTPSCDPNRCHAPRACFFGRCMIKPHDLCLCNPSTEYCVLGACLQKRKEVWEI